MLTSRVWLFEHSELRVRMFDSLPVNSGRISPSSFSRSKETKRSTVNEMTPQEVFGITTNREWSEAKHSSTWQERLSVEISFPKYDPILTLSGSKKVQNT